MGCHLANAPRVQGVIDEHGPLKKPIIVRFGVEPPDTDGQEPRPCRVGTQVHLDVRRMHDPRQTGQRSVIAEPELIDENLERALPGTMRELGIRRIKDRPPSVSATRST